jgi:hypothetical protein
MCAVALLLCFAFHKGVYFVGPGYVRLGPPCVCVCVCVCACGLWNAVTDQRMYLNNKRQKMKEVW